jgi:transcriptional regulator with XRE-family HTH domain
MGKILSALRKAMRTGGKSRYQLAKETGIDPAALSRFINDEGVGMGVENAEKLAEALGLDITIKAPKKGKVK